MAFQNPVFNPRIEEYTNSIMTDGDYEFTSNGKTYGQMSGGHKPEEDASTFHDSEVNKEQIYQQLAFPRSIQFVTRQASEQEQSVLSRVERSSVEVESTSGQLDGAQYDGHGAENERECPGKQQGSHSHIYGDPRYCLLAMLIIIVYLLLFVLVILLITGKIGYQFDNKMMSQGNGKAGSQAFNQQLRLDTNHCANSPCKNGGTCLCLEKDHVCLCSAGWQGVNCTTNINDCADSPCNNGGRCFDLGNGHFCVCAAGWTGDNCSTSTNDCTDSLCKNGGTCLDLENGYFCFCVVGWTGDNCTTNIDDCSLESCNNGGTCTDLVNDYSCVCAAGWTGKQCTTGIDYCADSPCKNNGTCLDIANRYTCNCTSGWTGDNCSTDIDECVSNPCKNGGRCKDLINGYNCSCTAKWRGENCDVNETDCSSIKKSGVTTSGIYSVDPDGKGTMNVYCDMVTDGGGWTVIQRREDGSVDFYLDWFRYKQGFGTLTGEFWLGNDNIHRLTASGNTVLRVELEDWSGNTRYALYGTFEVGDESNKYKLTVGSFSGTAGDSLAHHNGAYFSTMDRDNDSDNSRNCAQAFTGSWWYKYCYLSNLNGRYVGNKMDMKGITWQHWRGYLSMKRSVMKIRLQS